MSEGIGENSADASAETPRTDSGEPLPH
jgi:hypothetical protein